MESERIKVNDYVVLRQDSEFKIWAEIEGWNGAEIRRVTGTLNGITLSNDFKKRNNRMMGAPMVYSKDSLIVLYTKRCF